MALKKRSKKKKWTCTKCKNWDKNPHVCKHLEALLDTNSKQSIKATSHPNTDSLSKIDHTAMDYTVFSIPEKIMDGSYERKFKEKIRSYGLHPIQVEILVRKFFYEDTLKDITKELNISSVRTTFNLLNRALKDLKARGLK